MKSFQQAIREGDVGTIETLLNEKKQLAFYRDQDGSTSLHQAIEQKQFQVALNLGQRFSPLAHVKDSVSSARKNLNVHQIFFSL